MRKTHGRRLALGGTFVAAVAAAVLGAVALLAGTGAAASSAKPKNTTRPTISGIPEEGEKLTADRGRWSNDPTDFDYFWARCDQNGGGCANISGANARTYAVSSADVGRTLRFSVRATSAGGSTIVSSAPTAVIRKATPTPLPEPTTPPIGNGCPTTKEATHQVAKISPPARLLVDQLQADPRVVTSRTEALVLRFHVTSSCGAPVVGALVYATATPFNQFSIPAEQPSATDGWATLVFRRLSGFPVNARQQLIALFVRARKPGDNVLGGISTRRLFSVRVSLNR